MIAPDDPNGQPPQVDKDALLRKALMRDVALKEENERLAKQLAEMATQNELLATQVAELTRQVAELVKAQNKNSRNSNSPPSGDGLSERKKIRKKKKPTGRKRGGQKGHEGHYRALLPADQVDRIVDVFADLCEWCQKKPPQVQCGKPSIHQVVDILETGGREVVEYRSHTCKCHCGEPVSPSRDRVPSSAFGPRLKSLVSFLTGECHLSRRKVVVFLKDVFGITMSLGSVSNSEGQMGGALEGPSDEALEHAEAEKIKHIDETSWLRDFEPCSAWVIATAAVSVYRIVANGRRATLLKILQRKHLGILVSDRASVFYFWSMNRRQICWSHLQRAFVAFSQRDGPEGELGQDLVTCAELVFGYWRQLCSGELSREQFEHWMEALKNSTKTFLERAVNAGLEHFSGSCANMLKHWDAMWTFVTTPGVEPTNNHAERELRRLVIWRKRCFGSQSERGDRFVERMMTVTHTLRKQGRSVLDFLQASFEAMLEGRPALKLIASN